MPDAKFLYIYRDAKDVVDSIRHQPWAPKDLMSAIRFYNSWLVRWNDVREAAEQFPNFIPICYEDLVLNKTLWSELLDGIGLSYAQRPALSAKSIGRYKRWTNEEAAMFDANIVDGAHYYA